MEKKFYNTKKFKKMQKYWYEKLQKSGFDDIETVYDRENDCVHTQEFRPNRTWIVYNSQCLEYLHRAIFGDKLDRFIFEKHCDGWTNQKISLRLFEETGRVLDRRTIDRRILKILNDAGIRPVSFKD